MVAPQNLPQGVAPGPPMREKEKERRSQQPQRFVSPMELAPSNIFSEKSSYVDPVVQQIVAALEKNAEAIKDAELEVELRLGLLFPMGSGERLDLPCKGETMLKHCPQFHYRFAPGLPVDAFVTLSRRIEDMCSERQPREKRVECVKRFQHVVDTHYTAATSSSNEEKIRVTKDQSVGAAGSINDMAVTKKKISHFDLYTGRCKPVHGPAFDIRVAISVEDNVPDFKPSSAHKINHQREKLRKSYIFDAWRLDITSVTTKIPEEAHHVARSPPEQSFEVELELDSLLLTRNLRAKMAGQHHKLWELLSDFLFAGRDLACLATELRPFGLPPTNLAPRVLPSLDDKSKEAYVRKFNVAKPLIGHYLYRLAESEEGERLEAELASKKLRTEDSDEASS